VEILVKRITPNRGRTTRIGNKSFEILEFMKFKKVSDAMYWKGQLPSTKEDEINSNKLIIMRIKEQKCSSSKGTENQFCFKEQK
jgi:hypothetical protein